MALTASQGPPPLTLRTPVVAVTLPQPATIDIAARPTTVIDVTWPRTRTAQARRPVLVTGYQEAMRRPPAGMQRGTKKLRLWSPPPRR